MQWWGKYTPATEVISSESLPTCVPLPHPRCNLSHLSSYFFPSSPIGRLCSCIYPLQFLLFILQPTARHPHYLFPSTSHLSPPTGRILYRKLVPQPTCHRITDHLFIWHMTTEPSQSLWRMNVTSNHVNDIKWSQSRPSELQRRDTGPYILLDPHHDHWWSTGEESLGLLMVRESKMMTWWKEDKRWREQSCAKESLWEQSSQMTGLLTDTTWIRKWVSTHRSKIINQLIEHAVLLALMLAQNYALKSGRFHFHP